MSNLDIAFFIIVLGFLSYRIARGLDHLSRQIHDLDVPRKSERDQDL